MSAFIPTERIIELLLQSHETEPISSAFIGALRDRIEHQRTIIAEVSTIIDDQDATIARLNHQINQLREDVHRAKKLQRHRRQQPMAHRRIR